VPFHSLQDEQLVITITKQTASTRAYTAAGGSQIAPFFAADGYGATNPVSALSLSIYPSYYSGVEAVRPLRIRNRTPRNRIPPRCTAHEAPPPPAQHCCGNSPGTALVAEVAWLAGPRDRARPSFCKWLPSAAARGCRLVERSRPLRTSQATEDMSIRIRLPMSFRPETLFAGGQGRQRRAGVVDRHSGAY